MLFIYTRFSVYFFWVCLLISGVNSVDKTKFKTCEQSSFCRRCRKMDPGKSAFELDLDDVQVINESISTVLTNTDSGVKFNLVLSGLPERIIRVQVSEATPLRHRFYPSVVLDGEPKAQKLTLVSKSENSAEIEYLGFKVLLVSSPFSISVYDQKEVIIALNSRGLFRFEETRTKPSGEGEEAEMLKEEQESGMWEENFSSHHDSKPNGPTATAMDVSFPGAKVAYGLPEHADSLSLRTTTDGGEPYRFYNLDVFEYELDSPMALYGSVPLLIAHSGKHTAGVFWLNPSETWVDVTTDSSTVVNSIVSLVSGSPMGQSSVVSHFMSESGNIDVFLLLGPAPIDVVRQYISLVGMPFLPPIFSLGYHQSRWNYNSQDDVNEVHHNFDKYDIPMDVMWLDIEHTDGKKYFTWDPYKFSDPIDMQHNLTARGRKLVVIVDPHIKRQDGYFLHDDATANGYYVKNKDGSDYEGWCWPGSSSYLDLMNPDAEEYYISRYHLDKYKGSTEDLFLWNDMNEPSVFNGPEVTMPKDNLHYGGWEHREVHNLYGLYQVMGTYQGMLNRNSSVALEDRRRPFILSRSVFSGSQRYAAIWTGDNAAEWSHLKASIPMCLSLALGGFSFCGADVGGFFNNPQSELLVRWYQTGAWLPFFRAHAHIDTKRREPWLFGEEVTSLIRDTIRVRYSYHPLWYTLFRQMNLTGDPVIRPLFMEFPTDENTFNIGDQLIAGDALMVKPVTDAGATQQSVYFPGDSTLWYDVEDYKSYSKGFSKIEVNLAKVPVFQRGGTIVPKKQRVRRSITLMKNDPYTLVIAVDKTGKASGFLYIDDGVSHRFMQRDDSSVMIHYEFDGRILSSKFLGKSRFQTPSWLERVIILGPKTGIKGATLTDGAIKTELLVKYNVAKTSLTIRKPGVNIAKEWEIALN